MQSRRHGIRVCAVVLLMACVAMAQVPSSKRVILIIDENSSYSDVIANMPWLVSEGNANGYATNYHSDNGGSLLDYLWLASGSCESSANCTLPSGTHDFNCNGNDCYYPGTNTSDPITDDNIFREMNNAGISWKVYAQSYAAAGGTVTTPDNNNGTSYYRRHNGATWYSDVLNNVDGSAGKVVDLSQLATDLASNDLPRFMIIVPDGNHDAHDCPVGMSTCTEAQQLAAADQFLSETLGPILNTSDFQAGGSGMAFVTFDECGGGTNAGCNASVYTAVIGPPVVPHTVSSTSYKHENTLRTMIDALGIKTYPGAAATVVDMTDFFSSSTGKPVVSVSAPKNGASVNSPMVLTASAAASSGHSISGWAAYVDSVRVYSGGSVSSITTTLKLDPGSHTLVVRAWDTSGTFGDQTLSITVNAPKPTVNVLTPIGGTTVGSPVNFQAVASPTSGHTIGGWWIYVDSVGVYSAGSQPSINAKIPLALGLHQVVVRAWDNSGAYGDKTFKLTISTRPAVDVASPAPSSQVNSTFTVQASAAASSGRSIGGWHVYLDSVDVYGAGATDSIKTTLSASKGNHTLVIRAWDTDDAYGDQTIKITVP
jgi:hypothetical protein